MDLTDEALEGVPIQEPCSIRHVLRARELANQLIDDRGELDLRQLQAQLQELERTLYSVKPGHQHDAFRQEHMLHALQLFSNDKELQRTLRHMTRPFSNRIADDITRDTLLLSHGTALTDAHTRRACLAAFITTLRQSLGSCFATAPAIVIHQEQPHQFFRDLDEMMNTGRLKRTVAGREYSVPMCASWGNGDLKRPFLLNRNLEYQEPHVWRAPGIVAALEAVELLPGADPRALLQESLQHLPPGQLLLTNADELLSAILLQHYGIAQRDIDDYLARPRAMITGGLMLYVPKASRRSTQREEPCGAYLRDLAYARRAFKGLADCALLKSWEFTLASFAEIKQEFTQWNLYYSLGIHPSDGGGIGEYLYKSISSKIDRANETLQSYTTEFEQVQAQMLFLEGRAKAASTEREINWVKSEYQSRQAELYHIQELRQAAYERATKVSGLFQELIEIYSRMFADYFQEVYDPEIHDIAAGPYDDSPAGFRLIYKHGRANPSQWTAIHSLPEFVDALVSFFTVTEHELLAMPQVRGIEDEVNLLISHLVGHVRSEEFMESAFYRMARAHGVGCVAKPLQHLDQVDKKPWVYTAGGSMSMLVMAYFREEEPPFMQSRWVENETELFAWLLDCMRQTPKEVAGSYQEHPHKAMLMQSPTHAFTFKPGLGPFVDGWATDLYSYSWIKREIVEPAQAFASELWLDSDMASDLLEQLKKQLPVEFRARWEQIFRRVPARQSLSDFRLWVSNETQGMRTPFGAAAGVDAIDSVLYGSLPYTEARNGYPAVIEIAQAVAGRECPGDAIEAIRKPGVCFSSNQLLEMAKRLVGLTLQHDALPINAHAKCLKEMRTRRLALPAPVIFADTNWVKDFFAFVVNPVTGQLEFWAVDAYGFQGRPVGSWRIWLNGSHKEPPWGIYPRPYQYVSNGRSHL